MTSIKKQKAKKNNSKKRVVKVEEVKKDEVKLSDIKNDEIKTEEIKAEEVNIENKEEEVKKNKTEEEAKKTTSKKVKKNNDSSKRSKKIDKKEEDDDFFAEILDLLKNADYDKKTLEQKIDLAWSDSKQDFVNLVRQKNMYNKINLLFNKGSQSTKYDIVKHTLVNIIPVSSHEHSKQFILTLAKDNKKFLVMIINKLKEVSRDLICNRNGLFVMDEIYKMSNRKCRKDLVMNVLDIEEDELEVDDCGEVDVDGSDEVDIEDRDIEDGSDEVDDEIDGNAQSEEEHEHGECCNHDHEQDEHEEHDEEDEEEVLKAENAAIIKKLSSKRLFKYEITHHLLLEFLTFFPSETKYILDLLIRNKQMNLILQTYKGLEVCIKLLENNIDDIIKLITPDFINIVNNEYGVVFILKILETNNINFMIDLYTKLYKEIFINDCSVLPLLYIFNQERKYFPTLFNQLRTKELVELDKTYLMKSYKEIMMKNLKVFMRSFSWILVYFFSKKDDEIKKQTKIMFKEIESNEYSEKLRKKMVKYKLMK